MRKDCPTLGAGACLELPRIYLVFSENYHLTIHFYPKYFESSENPPATETNLIDTVPADFLTLGGIFGGMYTTPEGGVLSENQEVLRNSLERVPRLSLPCRIPQDVRWPGRSPGPAAAPKEDRQKFFHWWRIQDSKAVHYRLCSESPLR